MMFIALLIAATTAIAGAAAYFSVYGLAATFSGVFWSVVVMGSSLEAGKLVAASYLYRYWDKTNLLLKGYLMAGVATLMLLTSTGIFGYLSSGYQQDILPLQQKQQQVQLLDEEKTRVLDRKKQIDEQMASATSSVNINRSNGTIDPNAARVLREQTRGRDAMVRQYRVEQDAVNKRISELDKQLLELKQDLVKAEAHTGPIMYIAKAFGMPSDDATKYLIFLIIFAFDPMAVALTLAVNIALKLRKEELAALKQVEQKVEALSVQQVTEEPEDELVAAWPAEEIKADLVTEEVEVLDEVEQEIEGVIENEPDPDPVQEPTPAAPAAVPLPPPAPTYMPHRAFHRTDISDDRIIQLVHHYKFLRSKQERNENLTPEDLFELNGIENTLRNNGYGHYLS